MPIDISAIRGIKLPAFATSWTADDVILYHLALGAGDPPTDAIQQTNTNENCLSVLPTFSTIAAQQDHQVLLDQPGMNIRPNSALHGEQELVVLAPMPPQGSATVRSTVLEVIDKGSAALVILETVTTDLGGRPLCRNRSSLFLPGEGGFEPAPAPASHSYADTPSFAPCSRKPDAILQRRTLPQQALLYRLTGDKALLHADPIVAQRLGFKRPILHGLCTFGLACLAVVNDLLGGDVGRIARFASRFAAPVYPGETLEISVWKRHYMLQIEVRSLDRDVEVLSRGVLTTQRSTARHPRGLSRDTPAGCS